MARIPDVVPHTKIVTAWGNLVRDRTITPFVNAAERDVAWPAPPIGALCVLVTEGAVQVYLGTWERIGSDVPVGSIIMHSAPTPPADFVLCNGASLSRSVYPELFAVIGTGYGNVDATHFNVPNLVDRVPVGASASRPLGSAGGEATHVLTEPEMALHNHGYSGNTGTVSADHAHAAAIDTDGLQLVVGLSPGGPYGLVAPAGDNFVTFTPPNGSTGGATANHTHAFSGATDLRGANTAHNNMQPYQSVNYIIRSSS